MLAILSGVAVGLTSVAVAVILVVRNRSGGLAGEEAREGDAAGGSGGNSVSGESGFGGSGADGRGKYDAVATKEGGGDRLQMARCGELKVTDFDVIGHLWCMPCP